MVFDIIHHLHTTQTNGQTKVLNREKMFILEKTVNISKKDWAEKIDDALWAYRTTFKTPLGMSPFKLVFGKSMPLALGIGTQSILGN